MLLPSEVELCNAVGLSEEEYFYFVDLAESYNGKRTKEYELVPDVRNDFVTPIIVSLVVGVALQAVGALLAPKPRAQDQRERLGPLRTGDITGRSRFAPQSNFSSVQELATLGAVIPLIFTRRGVRVNSQLLWSQFRAKGLTQQLNAIFLFSAGRLPRKPDYAGFAIGDSQLESYVGQKLQLLFNTNGQRLLQSGTAEYPQGQLKPPAGNADVFKVFWDITGRDEAVFCQARFPSTQSEFGSYAPMPNGMRYKVNYELVLIINNVGEEAKTDARVKDDKIDARFPRRCAVTAVSNTAVTYTVGNLNENQDPTNPEGRFEPFGVDDVVSAVETTRIDADANIEVGEIYLVGTELAVCVSTSNVRPWEPGIKKTYRFEWLSSRGIIDQTSTLQVNAPDQKLVIQRAAIGTFTTSRPCDAVEVGIKSRVFKRINGFANVNSRPPNRVKSRYEDAGGGLTLGSINKYVKRYSFFKIQRKELGKGSFTDLLPGEFFAVRGNTPQDVYNSIRIYHPKTTNWEYRIVPYPGNQIRRDFVGQTTKFINLLQEGSRTQRIVNGVRFVYTGFRESLSVQDVRNNEFLLKNSNTNNDDVFLLENDAIADYVAYDAEELSSFSGPEHEISFVNEYTLNNEEPRYDNLAIAGIRIGASREWSNFDQFSAFFKRGIVTKRLINGRQDSVNTLPEIAYALLTDDSLGAGTLVGIDQVDEPRMKIAAQFCVSAGFFWDGVISDRQNIREFIFENAAYCLLDFTIIGGKFSLFPSVPISETNPGLNLSAKPDIKALFTDGNVRNLQVSFLDPEERQLFKAVVLWRQDTPNGFPQTRTLQISLNAGSDADPEEVFDLSGFCTSEEHARTFAKFALKTRKEVDHGIRFETTPQAALGLNPGDYFRLVSEATHTSRFQNGSISADGAIQAKDLPNGSYSIFYFRAGSSGLQSATLNVTNNRTIQGALFGSVFTIKNSTTTDRVYKVESLSYAEDGLVEIAGSNVPLTSSGTLEVLNWAGNQFKEVSY
jgi:hypothetical protein